MSKTITKKPAAKTSTKTSKREPKKAHPNIVVKRGVHGLGLFATGPIKKGEFIIEYWGDIIDEDEANRRGGKYLFELEHKMAIDGKSRDNIARYVNHSCSPNAEPEEDVKAQRVMISATRDIKAGEEIGYDYGKEYWDEHIKPLKCRCGCGGKGPKVWR